MKKIIFFFICLSLLPGAGVRADEVSVAVASNFKYTLQKLADDFTLETGHDVRISSASSGKLFAQIIHGAPYDVFFSADEKRVDLLIQKKMADAGNASIYALGKLVLMSNINSGKHCRDILKDESLNKFAIANPDIAPYGLAAKQVLQHLKLWQSLQPDIVMGENVAQTLQFISTGNADAGFVAESMLELAMSNMRGKAEPACIWHVSPDMYDPVKQKMVLLDKAKSKPSAQAFMQYLKSVRAKSIIESGGYDVP